MDQQIKDDGTGVAPQAVDATTASDLGVSNKQRHVLLVGALERGLDRVAPVLQRAEFDVHTVEASPFVLDLVMGTSFELLVVGYPMPEMDINELLRAVRNDSSGSRDAGLLLLAEPGFLEAAQALVARGANRAVALDWAESRLWQAVGDLLNIAPRVTLRAMLHAEVEVPSGHDRTIYQTVNLSISGMLLRGADSFTPGTRLEFIFRLPQEPRPVEGSGEIVRRTDTDREGVQGVGVRFLSLRDDGQYRLRQFVKYHRA